MGWFSTDYLRLDILMHLDVLAGIGRGAIRWTSLAQHPKPRCEEHVFEPVEVDLVAYLAHFSVLAITDGVVDPSVRPSLVPMMQSPNFGKLNHFSDLRRLDRPVVRRIFGRR
ncbi:hypothetical protein MYX84_08785 [Acidobacteria bacterium AH-259-O06]|nr:hypothetical protein [Acidobacteria bacterium AH-259-O06]